MAFKEGVVLGTVSLNATGTGTTAIAGTSNSGTITIGNTSSGAVTINSGTAGISLGTTANAHATTVGSTNSSSATTVQSGSGALNVTSTNGALTINSGTGALSVSNDASATTVNLATGAAAKTVTLGSTTTTSSLALKYGTSDYTLASATGTVMSALDTGEITYPLQSVFSAYLSSSASNVTGDGTLYGPIIFDTELFDQNSDYNNATGNFTAPVTGKYLFISSVFLSDVVSTESVRFSIVATGGTYNTSYGFATMVESGFVAYNMSQIISMTAADTCSIKILVASGAKTVDVLGVAGSPYYTTFTGQLVC